MTQNETRRRRRWPAAAGAGALAAALFLTGAATAGFFDLGSGATMLDENGKSRTLTIQGDKLVVGPVPTTSPTAPPTTTPPVTAAPFAIEAKATSTSAITVTWPAGITQAVYGRDGTDASGYGAWKSPAGATSPATLTGLRPATAYSVTVSGLRDGTPVTATVKVTTSATATTPPVTTPPPTQNTGFPALQTGSLGWISGASGEAVAGGSFATYRGTPVRIAGTWLGDGDNGSTFRRGGEYGAWKGSLDVGYRGVTSPSQWASCATGACDARWRTDLQAMRAAWESTDRGDGAFFLRLAWEMNGSWFNHHVDPANPKAFADSWARFSELRKQVFPAAKMVYSVNRDTSGLNYDWRAAIPGYVAGQAGTVSRYVDVMNVDYYSEYASKADTIADFNADALKLDGRGAPVGIERHRQLAAQFGLPFSVGEWSTVLEGAESSGDNPAFIDGMHAFFTKNAGTGAGQLLYEVQFSVRSAAAGKFAVGPGTRMPVSSARYAQLF